MEAHGGRINVESIVGQGTRVSLHFPLTKMMASQEIVKLVIARSPSGDVAI
jgi:chemotaxis protein histidine kinase CheA